MKTLFQSLILATSLIYSSAVFAEPTPYTQAAFDTLQKEGKPILVEIHASWCPTCRAQAPIVNGLLKQKEYQAITPLRVDFDTQKDIVKAFGATKQSTLIVFKSGKEVARSTGATSPIAIESLLAKAI